MTNHFSRILGRIWMTSLLGVLGHGTLMSQSPCPEDSLALNVTVTTDAWGYEMYWELLTASSECGDGSALLWGGNAEVGCGDGVLGLPGDVYGNNVVVSLPTLCVSNGDSLVLVHRDSYGDGGSQFSIALAGIEVYAFGGSGFGDDWEFQTQIMQGDLPCFADSIEADGPSWVGSIVEATVSPGEPSPPASGCGSYGGWCESGLSNTRWLVWEVPSEGGVYYITTCNEGTTFDTQLAMWEAGDCLDFSTFDLVNANDDIGCAFGAYRSGFLTPCLEGGETIYLQIDGYYGQVGDVEVSITSSSPEAWSVTANVQDLSCSLDQGFNLGAIYTNTNVGAGAVDWQWTGPSGYHSNVPIPSSLLSGVYDLVASFCGALFVGQFEVEEPAPNEQEWTVTANVQNLTCNLDQGFNPNGAISINTNAWVEAVEWEWTGPFGFTSNEATINPLLPGVYNLSASICEQSFSSQYEVEQPDPLEADVVLTPLCDESQMMGSLSILGDQNVSSATWTVGTFEANGVEVAGLPGGLCQVEVVDESGCETTEWVWVETVGVPDVDLGPDLFGCAGDAFTLLAPLGNGLTYTWTTGQGGPLVVVQTENPGTLVIGVEVSDEAGCSDTDAIILTLDDCASGLQGEVFSQGLSSLSPFPNPFEDFLVLEWPQSVSIQGLHLRDASGKEVACAWTRQGDNVKATLDVPAGMYVLTCDGLPGAVRVVRR